MCVSCSDKRDWQGLKRICHTWKGRNSQIGFRKSSHLAASLYDFLNSIVGTNKEGGGEEERKKESEMVKNQVEMFFTSLEKECGVVNDFLKAQSLLS